MFNINKKLLPIKAHFFFFFAAMGPIYPQFTVYGKQLGISPIVMGTAMGILPFAYFAAKPPFGLLVDVFRNFRKCIFIGLILIMTVSFPMMYFVPSKPVLKLKYQNFSVSNFCEVSNSSNDNCDSPITSMICKMGCWEESVLANVFQNNNSEDVTYELCTLEENKQYPNESCDMTCEEDLEIKSKCLYSTFTFWGFMICLFVACISCNIANSVTDAVSLDVIGRDGDYGQQRVWGTAGWGVAALFSGYIVSLFSTNETTNYGPAFIISIACGLIDIAICLKLKLPKIEAPKNILKDFKNLLKDGSVITFLTFATFIGVFDSLILYFILWYVEDLAAATNTGNVKLIEGLTVAAETLGGEMIFFAISGKILKRFGHINSFNMCFFCYGVRFVLISLAPSPWWLIPIELFFNGPTYALGYSAIVAYANELAPPGASATMQGIAAGMDDGLGFAIGGFLIGSLFKYVGPKHTLQILSGLAFVCCLAHILLHKTVLRSPSVKNHERNVEYKPPEEACRYTT